MHSHAARMLALRTTIVLGFLVAVPAVAVLRTPSLRRVADVCAAQEPAEPVRPTPRFAVRNEPPRVREQPSTHGSAPKRDAVPLSAPQLVEFGANLPGHEPRPEVVQPGIAAQVAAPAPAGAESNHAPPKTPAPVGATSVGAAPNVTVPYQERAALPTGEVDPFAVLQRQLRELGATSYLLETWGEDGQLYRFECRAGAQPGDVRQFEAVHRDALAAVRAVHHELLAWRHSTSDPQAAPGGPDLSVDQSRE